MREFALGAPHSVIGPQCVAQLFWVLVIGLIHLVEDVEVVALIIDDEVDVAVFNRLVFHLSYDVV